MKSEDYMRIYKIKVKNFDFDDVFKKYVSEIKDYLSLLDSMNKKISYYIPKKEYSYFRIDYSKYFNFNHLTKIRNYTPDAIDYVINLDYYKSNIKKVNHELERIVKDWNNVISYINNLKKITVDDFITINDSIFRDEISFREIIEFIDIGNYFNKIVRNKQEHNYFMNKYKMIIKNETIPWIKTLKDAKIHLNVSKVQIKEIAQHMDQILKLLWISSGVFEKLMMRIEKHYFRNIEF